VRRARDLAERHPDLDPILLTDALTQRSTSLWNLQRRPEASVPSEEAVRSARRLAGENPDAYAGDLAGALMGLAVDYSIAGDRRAERMALEQEAIDLLRPLASDLPDVYGSTLARTLHNLAIDHFETEDPDGVWPIMEEAVSLRRAALVDPYGIGMTDLASALQTLAAFHASKGDHRRAVERFEEAIELYERSTLPLSAAELNSQSSTVLELARSYEALGRTTEALTAVKQANAIRRRLSEYAPDLFTEPYAASLRDVSDLHRRQDRRIHERIALRNALPLHRRLAAVSEEGRERLAICLCDLGASYAVSYTTVGRAVTALTEAYELFTSLPVTEVRHERNVVIAARELSGALLKTSRFADAVRVAEHEVRLRRRLLVDDHEDDHEWPLYFAVLRLAEGRTMAGRPAAAWRTVLDAETVSRALLGRPDLTQGQVALLLRTLARAMSLCGRHDLRLAARALEPARRAARICRQLADREPSSYQNDLRLAVTTLATVLTRLGRHAEAAEARLRRGA
jgi:tetratricopeptide (TPR) repeat protein